MAEPVVPSTETFRRRTRPYDADNNNFESVTAALVDISPPSGTILPVIIGASPNDGWLICDGQAVSKQAYPTLYAIIGSQFGETGTTFNLPDLRGRTLIGTGAAYAPGLMGLAGQSEITLGVENLPAHSHDITDPGHAHDFTPTPHSHTITDPGHDHLDEVDGSHTELIDMGMDIVPTYDPNARTSTETTGISIDEATAGGTIAPSTTGLSIGDTGSGVPVSNLPPVFGVNWIIRT